MRERLLAFLKVSERPDPPPGSGADLATFRASRRFFYLSVCSWVLKQLPAVAGIFFALYFFGRLKGFFAGILVDEIPEEAGLVMAVSRWIFISVEGLAILTYVGQLVATGVSLKLGWELRWYMVGNEFLRIREGLWTVREQTVTVANIQNMLVRQGPIQKLFGIAELEVHTAGGGAAGSGEGDGSPSRLHVARFRGLEDAPGLRDRIRSRLTLHRGSGLGHGDEVEAHDPSPAADEPGDLARAARDLLEEARALRRSMTATTDTASTPQPRRRSAQPGSSGSTSASNTPV